MTNQTVRSLSKKDTAKLIREILKDKFPGAKFSVTSTSGSSIRVSYTDGPALSNVENYIADIHGATFDGMQDLKEYHNTEWKGEMVSFGNDFLFINRDYSESVYEQYAAWHNSFYGDSVLEYIPGHVGSWGYAQGYNKGDHDATRRQWEYLKNTGF